jgi:hypothetical protein
MTNIVDLPIKDSDSELLGEGISYLAEACARFMEIKHPDDYVLFRMTDAIMHYVENYLITDECPGGLPKPTHEYAKDYINDDDSA